MELDDGSGSPVVLQNMKRFVPVPYARLAVAASSFDVAQNLRVGGAVDAHAFLPRAQDWASLGLGDNEAAIYSDENAYEKLMIVGNDSAGGRRQVGVWDDLYVDDDLTVRGNLSVTGSVSGRSSCRSGYQQVGNGYCMSSSLKGAGSSQTAAITCANEGGHVCTVGEFYGWEWAGLGHPCINSSTYCWTQGFCPGTQALAVRVGSSWGCINYYDPSRQYRCCHSR